MLRTASRSVFRAPLARCASSAAYTSILHEKRPGGVGLITLNRPKALNALTPTLVKELVACALEMDVDPDVRAIVVTGSGDKAFVAGADIKTMQTLSYMDMCAAPLPHRTSRPGPVRVAPAQKRAR